MGVRDVVEEPERERHVEPALERGGEEVAVDELHLLAEALQALCRQIEHLLGDVRVHPLARAGFEDQLTYAARAAADVEHARLVVLPNNVEREIAALSSPGRTARWSGCSSSYSASNDDACSRK